MSIKNQVKWVGTMPARASISAIGQVSVGDTATEIKGIYTDRHSLTIVNHSSVDVYLGQDNTVTTANGILLRPKQNAEFTGWDDKVFGIVAAGTATVGYWDMKT